MKKILNKIKSQTEQNHIEQQIAKLQTAREKMHRSTTEYNLVGYHINRIVKAVKRHVRLRTEDGQKEIALSRMTNWQRNQCLKHFKSNLRNATLDEVALFCDVAHWKEK